MASQQDQPVLDADVDAGTITTGLRAPGKVWAVDRAKAEKARSILVSGMQATAVIEMGRKVVEVKQTE